MHIVFACNAAIGHLNPMLALARALADRGYGVHFRSVAAVRARIEGAGATFHDAAVTQPEFYAGRKLSGPLGALEDLMEGLGIDTASFLSQLLILNVALEQQLPGALRLLRELRPAAVVYDPLSCRDMMFAAKMLGIPAVGVWSLAGPGAWPTHSATTMLPLTLAEADTLVAGFAPHAEATERIRQKYGLELCTGLPQPAGKVDSFVAEVVLVTTSSDLQDPMASELASAYEKDGTRFAYIGPLLADSADSCKSDGDEVVRSVRAARAQGRPVILVSMGTLLVSDHKLNGWEGRSGGSSLTGRQLCQAAWGGAFDAFGSTSFDEGALVVVSLGPRPHPLGDVAAPPNALCSPYVDQQQILRAGVDLFLTHGGQNSFTEAMAHATPVVVCPGFGDQVVNSRKAVGLGVGLKVDRPRGECGSEGAVAARYRAEVRRSLLEVYAGQRFKSAAEACAGRLQESAGLRGAVELVLSAAAARGVVPEPSLPEAFSAGGGISDPPASAFGCTADAAGA